ncbi:hypothetical protein DPMN_070738 [Dreissena polymorpha]|uniref:Uncharacterized protein n=1 Tax=Dreissena polymorpha TaxID=45954 RepID=A0A9D3Z5Q1_DREPO|nr:hypothetical protein DPMN_070738 [Dreissena polymorpha]
MWQASKPREHPIFLQNSTYEREIPMAVRQAPQRNSSKRLCGRKEEAINADLANLYQFRLIGRISTKQQQVYQLRHPRFSEGLGTYFRPEEAAKVTTRRRHNRSTS